MKIFYLGELKSVINNLQKLGVDISFSLDCYCKGIIATDTIPEAEISLWKEYCSEYNIPLIIKGNKLYNYTGVNVLVLDETEKELFYKEHNITTLQECKDRLRELKIHYLVIALTKEEIKQQITRTLPSLGTAKLNITDKQVTEARDILTALVGYIYIKEGTLSADALTKANTNAIFSVVGFTGEDLKDFYLDIDFGENK
jgi:hypothetical protein